MNNATTIYGQELILDLHNCNSKKFNRSVIDQYFAELCDLIDMKKCERYWWDYAGVPVTEQSTDPRIRGSSAVQFILTSSIVIHTLELLENVYVNIFSCKSFDTDKAMAFTVEFFEGEVAQCVVIDRK